MIFVDRTAVDLPVQLKQKLQKATESAKKFYADIVKTQERFDFDNQLLHETLEYLRRLFDDTCAYCETSLLPKELIIEQFRPKTEACDLDGATDPNWYWWLAYEWENLYLVCKNCYQHKKNLFPVIGQRVKIGKKGEILRKENYLLLDPCFDQPAEHLLFADDGSVQSISQAFNESETKSADRGAVTVKVCALNRDDLIVARQKIIKQVSFELELPKQPSTTENFASLIRAIEKLIDEFSEFVGLKRQLVARFLTKHSQLRKQFSNFDPSISELIEEKIKVELKVAAKLLLQQKTDRNAVISQPETSSFTIGIKYDNNYIQSLEIRNFRAISYIKMNFNISVVQDEQSDSNGKVAQSSDQPNLLNETPKRMSWKMIVGENGIGKSSILKAIILALSGEDFYRKHQEQYRWQPPKIFNNKTHEKIGFIKIKLSKGELIEVRFNKKKLDFITGKNGIGGVFIRGYGSARLFAQNHNKSKSELTGEKMLQDFRNLFQPESLLPNPTDWLSELDLTEFNSAALSIGDLLNLTDTAESDNLTRINEHSSDAKIGGRKQILSKKNGEILLDNGFGLVPLTEQSDGYKSVLALMVDIFSGLHKSMHDKREATGIVLLDEIESHLHPRWKMKIVSRFRAAFPNIQFIVTTHDPLCLKGLGKGEITVIKRDSGNTFVFDDISSPSGLRVDQLLTSELFGLDSTIDPEIDDKFYNYYCLLAKINSENLKEIKETDRDLLKKLKAELQQYNKLGFTRRDRLVYEFIDEYIAQSKNLPNSEKRRHLREETKQKIFEIWDMVKFREA